MHPVNATQYSETRGWLTSIRVREHSLTMAKDTTLHASMLLVTH